MQQQPKFRLRLLAGWCGLLLYVGVFSPVGMGVVALLGTMDPDHHAFLQPGPGGMQLVLHHDAKCSGHQHHGVARALTFFSQPAGATDPDHVVQFAAGAGIWCDNQQIVSKEIVGEQTEFVHVESVSFAAHQPTYFLPPPGPPPGTVAGLLNLRSTVLLI